MVKEFFEQNSATGKIASEKRLIPTLIIDIPGEGSPEVSGAQHINQNQSYLVIKYQSPSWHDT